MYSLSILVMVETDLCIHRATMTLMRMTQVLARNEWPGNKFEETLDLFTRATPYKRKDGQQRVQVTPVKIFLVSLLVLIILAGKVR